MLLHQIKANQGAIVRSQKLTGRPDAVPAKPGDSVWTNMLSFAPEALIINSRFVARSLF